MEDVVSQSYPKFDKVITHFTDELKTLRTGRATPALLDSVQVSAYGAITPLTQVANINVPDPKTLTIEPWDKSILKDVEKALVDAELGMSPVVDGSLVRLSMPQMTEENRKGLIKIMHVKVEEARITIRQVRDAIKEDIVKKEKDGEFTQDDKYLYIKKLDDKVNELNTKIKDIGQEKEKEIMKV